MARLKRRKKLNHAEKKAGRIGNGGFSLVEVIIAIVLLALITIPLMNYFTNSMKHSARMARRQRATLMAQEITENLKAVDKLFEKNVRGDGSVYYRVANLPADFIVTSTDISAFNEDEGKGKIILTGTKGDFDVSVTLDTNVSINEVERSLIYGLDDSTDLLILEQAQMSGAMAYFSASNGGKCPVHYNADGSNASLTSPEEIANHLSRIMNIEIGVEKDAFTNHVTAYSVQAYYDYEWNTVIGPDTDTLQFQSSYLIDTKIETLKNLYLLYNRIGGIYEDRIQLTVPSMTTDLAGLDIYLIVQSELWKGTVLEVPTSSELSHEYVITVAGADHDTRIKYHSNIRTTDKLKYGSGTLIDRKPLTETGTPIRVIGITATVYELNHTSEDDALATMVTTKGE